MKLPFARGPLAAFFTSVLLSSVLPTHASITWTGATDGNWATTSNWSTAALPTADDTVIFDAASTQNLTIGLGENRTITGITLTSPAETVTLQNNILTIGKGGIDMSAATTNLIINSAVTIAPAGRQEWNLAEGQSLLVAAMPNKPGVPAANTGSLQISTTGTVILGNGTANLINDAQNNPWVTYGPNDWAGTNAGEVVASTYTDVDGAGAPAIVAGVINNIMGNLTGANGTDIAALRYNADTPFDVTVANSGTARTMTARGILVTENSAGGSLGGNLRDNAFVRPNRVSTAGSSFNIIQNSASDFTIGANIANGSSGAPTKLVKTGPGKLILLRDNGYSGGTFVDEGIVQFGDGSAPSGFVGFGFPGGGDIVNNGSLHFRRHADVTLGNNISGTGDLTQYGPGTLNLTTSVSTFTGPVNILGGTLAVTTLANLGNGTEINIDGGALGFLAAIDPSVRTISFGGNGATLNTNGNDITLANAIGNGGTGSLTKTGAGKLILQGANDYSGNTTITAGTLVADNLTGSATGSGAVEVATGGSLGGTGTITGAVNVASGGKIAPGDSVGTLTVGSLSLNNGALLDFEFSNTPANDRIDVSGSNGLTINGGSISLLQEGSAVAFSAEGTYQLFQYSGSITGDVSSLSVANPQPGFNYTFGTDAGFVTLTIETSGTVSFWDVNGGGTWNSAGNWDGDIPDGIGATANFQVALDAPATITLDGSRTVGSITFLSANNGYTIAEGSGGSLILNNGANPSAIVDSAGSHTISAPVSLQTNTVLTTQNETDSMTLSGLISGSASFTKTGPGSLALLADNAAFSGNVSLSGGTTTFATGGLGTGDLHLEGETLVWAGANTSDISDRNISFGDDDVTFDVGGNDVTLANVFGDPLFENPLGGLVKSGEGRLTLGTIGEIGGFTGTLTISEGTLRFAGEMDFIGHTNGIVNNGTLELDVTSSDPEFPSVFSIVVSGSGDLEHTGSGTTEINSANTFTGTTFISDGTLALQNPLALQGSTLSYDSFGGDLDIPGLTAVTLGALSGDKNIVLANGLAEAIALTVGGNGAATTYEGSFSGAGSLTKVGAGTMILTGIHSYTGATTVTNGTGGGAIELGLGAEINGGPLNISVNSRFSIFGGSLTATGDSNVSNGGSNTAVFQIFDGEANFENLNALGNANNGYLIEVAGGQVTANNIALGRSALTNLTEPTGGSTISGLYINGGDVSVTGDILMGDGAGTNSAVNVRIDSGSLEVGGLLSIGLNNGGRWSVVDVNGGTLTSTNTESGIRLGGPLAGNAALIINNGTATAERIQFGLDAVAGTHVLRLAGFGELYVGAGGLVDAGTANTALIRLTGGLLGAKAGWSTDIPVETSGTFEIRAADALDTQNNITLSGPITGTGSLTKTGLGTLTLSGVSAYSGETYVAEGTLIVGANVELNDEAAVRVDNEFTNGVLHLDRETTDIVAAFIVDGEDQGSGVFDSVSHPGIITGDGKIEVLGSDDPFTDWIDTFVSLTEEADKEKGADPDGDGLTNLEEFALDSDPTSGTASSKTRGRVETVGSDQALVITLPVRVGAEFGGEQAKTATIDGVIYTIRGSNNLVDFDQIVTEVIPASTTGLDAPSEGWEHRTFRLAGAIGGATPRGPKGFLDIEIEEEAAP